MICLNRKSNGRGVAHGGVAVVHNTASCTLEELRLPNPREFEVLVTLSNIPGHSRKLVTMVCHLPPTTR